MHFGAQSMYLTAISPITMPPDMGGALCNSLATFNVKNCIFENNRAGEMAGAIVN